MNVSLASKQDAQKLLCSLLTPLKEFYSPGKARLILGSKKSVYSATASYMEAFVRPLWGLVPFWAGGGREPELEEIYRRGLAAGTDPHNPEYWGECRDHDQKFVEMAAIGYGMIFARPVLWDPLTGQEKDRLCCFLDKINHHTLVGNNWLLFAVLVNLGLKAVGRPWDRKVVDRYLDTIDGFYVGDGWYCDGHPEQKDYYVAFAIHAYTLIYSIVMESEDPVRASRYKERAALFAKEFVYFFDEDGDSVSYGRSLIYRFAQVSFFSFCLLADVQPFPIGEMKGLIARHLRAWLAKPILDHDGILTVGYGYENWVVAETYGAPGGPYWAMKAFAFLALPEDHPFWQAEELSLPELPKTHRLNCAAMLAKRYPHRTALFVPGLFNVNGHGQVLAKYSKFVYDSKFSVCMQNSAYTLEEAAPDCMLAFEANGYVHVRRHCLEYEVTEDSVRSVWSPCPGIRVETTLIPTEQGHRRIHVVTSELECLAYDCGFAVDQGTEEPQIEEETGPDFARLKNDRCRSSAFGDGAQGGKIIYCNPNLNLLYEKVRIPAVCYRIAPGVQTLVTRVEADWM